MEYVDNKVRDLSLKLGEKVLLKASPMNKVMWFDKKCNLSPQCIGIFKVLEDVVLVAYRLVLPSVLSWFYPLYHVVMFNRYHGDGGYKKVYLGSGHSLDLKPLYHIFRRNIFYYFLGPILIL